jgi:hypothetical protein
MIEHDDYPTGRSKGVQSEKILKDAARLPQDAKARKGIPIARGVLDYFPAAIAAVAEVSRLGNEQHNPGQPLHWAREKSTDHADCIARHLIERGTVDTDGARHSAKLAWRALALLQTEIEDNTLVVFNKGEVSPCLTAAPMSWYSTPQEALRRIKEIDTDKDIPF